MALTKALNMRLILSPKGDEVLSRSTGRRASLQTLPSGHLAIDLMHFAGGSWQLRGPNGRAEGPPNHDEEQCVDTRRAQPSDMLAKRRRVVMTRVLADRPVAESRDRRPLGPDAAGMPIHARRMQWCWSCSDRR